MNEIPLVTVGIACYNASDTIERAIKSALAQTWENKEILVVDDNSTDNSLELVEKLMAQNKNIRVLKNSINRGVGFVRQTIVENAKGEFVTFFDDDDVSLPNRVDAQCNKIIASEREYGKERIVCHISGERHYPNGYILPLNAIGSDGRGVPGDALADRLLYFKKGDNFFFGCSSPTCSMMARKSTFMEVGGFRYRPPSG